MIAIKKIGGMVLDIFIALIIIIATATTILILTTNKDGIPNLFGYSPFSVQSNSMSPTFKKGDLIIVKKTDITSLKKGDIISFFAQEQGKMIIKTHRISAIDNVDTIVLTTKGDANELEDDIVVTDVDLVGKYIGKRIPYIGAIMDFLKSKWGFLLFIIIPLALLFIIELRGFIKLIIEEKEEELKSQN